MDLLEIRMFGYPVVLKLMVLLQFEQLEKREGSQKELLFEKVIEEY